MIVERRGITDRLRLPTEGWLDLTYRCNHDCRHCWCRLPIGSARRGDEMSLDGIRAIADRARALGCRRWGISGGEPMLRPDFAEIFAYLTARSEGYLLNTNGTLITPGIARLLVRRGAKMVALYGATAEVCDHITRTPGSFEAAMRGFAYLREAGAGFIVQVVPMRDNWHQFEDMVRLAKALSPHYRIGASWLYLAGPEGKERNAEIARQRLAPAQVVDLDPPDVSGLGEAEATCGRCGPADDRLFAGCILGRNQFHIDPYGTLSFCAQVRDPELRVDLRQHDFATAWEQLLPALAERSRGGQEYVEGCGRCDLRSECRWCGAVAHLEHGRAGERIGYLCSLARESRSYRERWEREHRRYFRIAGVTVRVDADVPIQDGTFARRLAPFAVDGSGEDNISLHHHFTLPEFDEGTAGELVYRKAPWAIFRAGRSWTYAMIPPEPEASTPYRLGAFNHDHSRGHIYHPDDQLFREGDLASLTMFPSDQIVLARVMADRQACFIHSAAAVLDGAGLLFVGHSGAGKSTTVKLLAERAEILCDDRNIVRRWPEGFRVHGSWSHGEVRQVSSASAPLTAILLLQKAGTNRLMRLADPGRARDLLLACLIKPSLDRAWWEKALDVIEALLREIPCFEMRFDRSGDIVPALVELAHAGGRSSAGGTPAHAAR